MDKWLIDGVPGRMLPVDDRGLAYGDGLFETVAIRAGRARFLERHFERLRAGTRRLGMPAPDWPTLRREVKDLARHHDRATVKIIWTRGSGPRGYAPPAAAHPTRVVGLQGGPPARADAYTNGVATIHCATPIGVNPALAGLKTLGRLEQVLARSEWRDPDIAEGLMSTADGHLICGTMSNVFIVRDGLLLTPDLSRSGVAGIMRGLVLEAAPDLDLAVRIGVLGRELLDTAHEVFLTNSLIGIWPVAAIESRVLGPGPITRRLTAALAVQGVDECGGR